MPACASEGCAAALPPGADDAPTRTARRRAEVSTSTSGRWLGSHYGKVCDGLEVRRLNGPEQPVILNVSLVKPDRATAEALQHPMIVPRRNDDSAALDQGARLLLENGAELVV